MNPNPRIDLHGQRFGRLLVVGYVGSNSSGTRWNCLCDCGTLKVARSDQLRAGDTRSCGCLKRESARRHGHCAEYRRSGTYKSWESMRARCLNPRSPDFHYYGARGVTVCARWNSFANFLADMGERPKGLTIERVDNGKGYEPDNCIWATRQQQAQNRRRPKRSDPTLIP